MSTTIRRQLIVADQPGVWTVEARASVFRVNDELGLGLPIADAYESIAGLILHQLRRLPERGKRSLVGDMTLRVIKARTGLSRRSSFCAAETLEARQIGRQQAGGGTSRMTGV